MGTPPPVAVLSGVVLTGFEGCVETMLCSGWGSFLGHLILYLPVYEGY
jgi:hypothetical protein